MSKAYRKWKNVTYDALKSLHFFEFFCNDCKRTMSGYKKCKKYISSYKKRFKKIRFAIDSLPPHKKYDSKYREAFYTLIAWRLFHKELDSMNKIERVYPDFVKWIAESTFDIPMENPQKQGEL